MDGIHDVGGMHGFGPIDRDDPALEPWEAAVIAINNASMHAELMNIDEFRHGIERMDPAHYLSSPYFEHWLDGITRVLLEKGHVDADELQRRLDLFEQDPETRFESPPGSPSYEGRSRAWSEREETAPARFAVGDSVRMRATHVRGHTRLPRYARGKPAVIHAVHGVHVFPDANAHGLGEQPAWLYSVRFDAADLWPDDIEHDRQSVYLDAWEPYLLPLDEEEPRG
ncbi:MAG: nitrile hydratase subunit beta [Chloroflexi bacterium]|nr:nitrile hydratase subunit beta [Chloroflexota bacterium]